MTKRDDERAARWDAIEKAKREWHWEGDADANEYILKRRKDSEWECRGRIYRTAKSLGDGTTQRGWGVATYPPGTKDLWNYGPGTGIPVTFLPHMPSAEAKAAAKVILLAGDT